MHISTPVPRQYLGVMVSSTFTDLEQHRTALLKAISGQPFKPVGMENDTAKSDLDVIASSLQMVQDSAAYIGIISKKYGQTPKCFTRNPSNLSVTELEFNEALRLNRPILLFVMGDEHKVFERDIEPNATKKRKLKAFRERAKQMQADSSVNRIYATFNSIEDFEKQSIQAVASLYRHLEGQSKIQVSLSVPEVAITPTLPLKAVNTELIPQPPDFYAEPHYIGSHEFVGRQAQLEILNDWVAPADPHPLLLFEAIGGTGKSMLTWQWVNKHAATIRPDWAGRFWYSFYEGGATMAVFCQRALAYITGQPFEELRQKKTAELAPQLLAHLRARPWLLILDGLERVLVSYHRFDAAQVADEEAGNTDQIAQRDPCAAIRPEDDDLLRMLAGAAPSKLLLTTRLTPRILLNAASQAIPGVLRVPLPGLRAADAERLFRNCGIRGVSVSIQAYLKSQCDCHPLVIGVLAGLVQNYLPDRGNFDIWVADPNGGGKLNLADLDLNQKRNHILRAAFEALRDDSRQLLSTLALLPESVDYTTLSALNPHLPPEPSEVEEPISPEEELGWTWDKLSEEERITFQEKYEQSCQFRIDYEKVIEARKQLAESYTIQKKLAHIVQDLDSRGLLQYDPNARRYDLHPVVRGIAAGGLQPEEKGIYGQRVVDYFSRQAHRPYEEAEVFEDVSAGLHVIRALLQMGRFQQACDVYVGPLAEALVFNLEANAEILALLSPFFPKGWSVLPESVKENSQAYLANAVGSALSSIGEPEAALIVNGAAMSINLQLSDWSNIQTSLFNIGGYLYKQDRLAKVESCYKLYLSLAELGNRGKLFHARLSYFNFFNILGRVVEAEAVWQLLKPMGRDWPRHLYRPGTAEFLYAQFRFRWGELDESFLKQAEQIALLGKNRNTIRALYGLRGAWRLKQGQWALAIESLSEAVHMARAIGQADPTSETQLALAKFHLNQLADPRHEAEQLARIKNPAHLSLARLWLSVGEPEQAKKHAMMAYREAWADGEPYVYRYGLDQAHALLQQLGVEIPILPPYDPAKDTKLVWEDEVAIAIEQLRIEKAAQAEPKSILKKKSRAAGGNLRNH